MKATNKPSNTPTTGSSDPRSMIRVTGARVHNLKNISLDLPRNQLIVLTGPSGSGKSSLAFDCLFAEGQRRYIESLSTYARQFLEQLEKPDVESIRGLCPSLAIQQKIISKNPRSTVGTITEIYDFYRLLFSRTGKPHCPDCQKTLSSQSTSEIAEQIMQAPVGTKMNIIAPLARSKKGEFFEEFQDLMRLGFVRCRIDGIERTIEVGEKLNKHKPHTIEIYVDRLILKEDSSERVQKAVSQALHLAHGQVQVEWVDSSEVKLFSHTLSCPDCGKSFPELTPRLFSFNSPIGWCESCHGLGVESWSEENQDEEEELPDLRDLKVCVSCLGKRLRPEALSVFVGEKSISDITALSVEESITFFSKLKFTGNSEKISVKVIKEILARLGFLKNVGLHYLTINRLAGTLSGGEEQRVRLASQLGTHLTGVLYILDEPSIGLHQIDNEKLIESLRQLRDSGNTVLVVEHDIDTMLAADRVIDLGPGAGKHGGFIVAEGPPLKLGGGLTSEYLTGTKKVPVPVKRRKPSDHWISFEDISIHNIKNLSGKIPLGCFVAITGVSGSGKSSLVLDVLARSLGETTSFSEKIKGSEKIDKIIQVTQDPIGRTPRSNPATYADLFGPIRSLFAELPAAKARGYTPGRFSFNVKGGRCAACEGRGELKIEMHFMPNVRVPCETCSGRRYNSETLSITFKGKSIADVLNLSLDEAKEFFESIPSIYQKIKVLCDVGLGYLKLGQAAPTLSGGEAQRLKLAKELTRPDTGKTLYIFDEPTTGLHLIDIEKLLKICHQLVDKGNTVVIIEHQMDVILNADWIIDMGPEGGLGGGKIVAEGSPELVAKSKASKTSPYIKKALLQ